MALVLALALAFTVGAIVRDTLGQVSRQLSEITQSVGTGSTTLQNPVGTLGETPGEPWGNCEEDEAWVPATYGTPGSREDLHGVNRVCSPIDEDL